MGYLEKRFAECIKLFYDELNLLLNFYRVRLTELKKLQEAVTERVEKKLKV